MKNIVKCIKDIATEIGKFDCSLEWYLFGSYLSNPQSSKDIDLLVVYESIDTAKIVRNKICDPSLKAPLHLLLMHKDEEEELEFIKLQNAKDIFSYN